MSLAIQDALAALIEGHDLATEDAADVMQALMAGESTPAQTAALLTALRMKGETVDEIVGFARTMRDHATKVPTTRKPLIDTCGTGGDGSGTFNISTAAAFVAAGARVAVAKHGNRSASSLCGSADVLEALGINLDATPEFVGRCVDEVGIGFLFARALHPSMKHVAPIRTELRMRTVFNLLGPLTNPAGADGQVMGIFDQSRIPVIAEVLLALGGRHAFVVAGCDGLDELTLAGPTTVGEAKDGKVSVYEVTPDTFGFQRADATMLAGGDAEENARILRNVLEGGEGPRRDIVALNAAPAIVAGERASDLAEGVAMAQASIDSGAALAKLDELIAVTQAGQAL